MITEVLVAGGGEASLLIWEYATEQSHDAGRERISLKCPVGSYALRLQSEGMQGFAADPVYAKGEVFAYVGLPQNLKDLKDTNRSLSG